ncbi:MAG: flagellar motor protein MotA [Proteobacteria bacterium]|nr:flagellar motor protein MotA [Pseudomonadota bacterium]
MTRPRLFLTRMTLFLVATIAVAAVMSDTLAKTFASNPLLNGLILLVLLLGIGYIFRQVFSLYGELRWIEAFRSSQPKLAVQALPKLLAPMATMMGESQGQMTLSALSMRTLLDGIGARLDESRDISRYLISLLIFLGLLGTFWGLLQTIFSVGDVVQSLTVGDGDISAIFRDFKRGLLAPLAGMGTAFSSSLFGLAGSLVLGFLNLQSTQAQNRFYNDLEEWLSGLTRLSSASALGDGGQSIPAYVNALLEQTADSLEKLQRTMTRGEASRMASDGSLLNLTEKLATLSDQMQAGQALLIKLVESQVDMRPLLVKLTAQPGQSDSGFDDATRSHIRNIDVHLVRLLEETITGRNQMVDDLRSEIKLLARTIATLDDSRES